MGLPGSSYTGALAISEVFSFSSRCRSALSTTSSAPLVAVWLLLLLLLLLQLLQLTWLLMVLLLLLLLWLILWLLLLLLLLLLPCMSRGVPSVSRLSRLCPG